jgi:hypothetical protein
VEITGNDGKKHFLTTDAASAFAAVERAIEAWSRLWWWSPEAVATVRRNEESWNISVSRVAAERARGKAP